MNHPSVAHHPGQPPGEDRRADATPEGRERPSPDSSGGPAAGAAPGPAPLAVFRGPGAPPIAPPAHVTP
ncbi:MAG: hypothetical protein ACRDT6_27255, partial [Micromonosporaceae bacterium]